PDGRLIYGLAEEGNDQTCNYWAVVIDPRTGTPAENPRRVTNWLGFCVGSTSATADGKRLVFMEWFNKSSVYVANLRDNGTRITTPRLFTFSEGHNMPLDWTADGRAILFASTRNGHLGIFRQSLDAETPEAIVSG